MQLEQRLWTAGDGWRDVGGARDAPLAADLVLVFGARAALQERTPVEDLRRRYPRARVVSCSSGGEIHGTEVGDDSVVATAIAFESTRVEVASDTLSGPDDSGPAGARLAAALPHAGLRHVFVLSEGLEVNGSALVRGLTDHLPLGVSVTGGLSADGERFQKTLIGLDACIEPRRAVAVGFYGDRLRVAFGSLGGWDTFGPDRLVTRSDGNVLYELDGMPALDLYKRYLGPHADELPASGLLFPIQLSSDTGGPGVVRTILGIDEADGSLR